MNNTYYLVSYPDGQIIIQEPEQFEKSKNYYSTKKVGEIVTDINKSELSERIFYPMMFHDTWCEKAYSYK